MLDRSHEYFGQFFCQGKILAFYKAQPNCSEIPIETIMLSDCQKISKIEKMKKIRLILETSLYKYTLTFSNELHRENWEKNLEIS